MSYLVYFVTHILSHSLHFHKLVLSSIWQQLCVYFYAKTRDFFCALIVYLRAIFFSSFHKNFMSCWYDINFRDFWFNFWKNLYIIGDFVQNELILRNVVYFNVYPRNALVIGTLSNVVYKDVRRCNLPRTL